MSLVHRETNRQTDRPTDRQTDSDRKNESVEEKGIDSERVKISEREIKRDR